MVKRLKVLDALFIGIISGCVLGFFLKLAETMTSVRVYTLLLNVDFLPVIGVTKWPEPIEFIFHLVISIALSFIFLHMTEKMKIGESLPKLWVLSFTLSLPTFALYFPLSILAMKEVPAWNDRTAFMIWSIAHLLYASTLPILFKVKKKRSTSLR